MTTTSEDRPATGDAAGGDAGGARWRRWVLIGVIVAVVVGLGIGLGLGLSSRGSDAPHAGPEGVPVQNVPDLASPDTTAGGHTVGGITCQPTQKELVNYHIHVYVSVFVFGQQRRVPAGVGIPPPRLTLHLPTGLFYDGALHGCLYWLHVHANDGIIHVESPVRHTFTLGQLFEIWQQPLGRSRVGPARGHVVAFVSGRVFVGNPRNVPLLPGGVIQLDVGTPVVPFKAVHFRVTGSCGVGTKTCSASSK